MLLPKDEAELKKMIADAVTQATSGLISKRDELLGKLTEAKKIVKKVEGVDVDQLLTAQEKLAKIENDKAEQDGEYKKLYEKLKGGNDKTVADLQAQLEAQKTANSDLIKKTNLAQELTANGVIPGLSKGANVLLMDKLVVDPEGNVLMGDKPLAEGLKEWAKGDEGKHYFTDGNAGGDANGPGKGGVPEAEYYDPNSPKFNRTQQAQIANANPALHQKLAAAAPAKKEA